MARTRLFGAVAIAWLTAVPAFAADLRVAPAYKAAVAAPAPMWNWSGFYIGGHVGYGAGDARVSLVPGPGWTIFGSPAIAQWLVDNGTPKLDSSGALGGVQAGFNVQSANWVWGIESDFSFSGIKGSRNTGILLATPPGLAPRSFTESDELKWLATFRGRFGYAYQQVLIYVTGGAAIGRREFSQFILSEPAFNFNNIRNSVSSTKVGWTAGAGFEYAIARNWSFKAEYLYVDLGRIGSVTDVDTSPGVGLTVDSSSRLTLHTARVGLNYKFDWGGPVVAKY